MVSMKNKHSKDSKKAYLSQIASNQAVVGDSSNLECRDTILVQFEHSTHMLKYKLDFKNSFN